MSKTSIFSSVKVEQNFIFSEIGIGIPANAFLLLFYILSFLLKHKLKPTDLTIGHLALIHLVMLIIMRVIAMDVFEFQEMWNDITCKTVFYFYLVLRGLSLCTTSLLSVLQAITLSPRSSWLAKFKQASSRYSLFAFIFLWIFNLSMSARFLINTVASANHTSKSIRFVTNSCSIRTLNYSLSNIFDVLWIFRDIFLTGLMALSSAYMVTLLCRHKRQSQHLHSTSLSPRASPELRATRTILLLMGVFVLMYVMDCIVYAFSWVWRKSDPILLCVHMLVGIGYASIGPLVLISREKRIIRLLKFIVRW
ncbi:vomeronasal type-1 receptor 90-like [Ochotona curzoniae]|uniref:vomeronasal type-1 receptor 90-like n=1 Tax=Ochotona curzoniae TaxID=130825 RepID=UPI001B353BC8|nr:vomeronasal type-1 receptor 90-like [Ochotona curzoniae]